MQTRANRAARRATRVQPPCNRRAIADQFFGFSCKPSHPDAPTGDGFWPASRRQSDRARIGPRSAASRASGAELSGSAAEHRRRKTGAARDCAGSRKIAGDRQDRAACSPAGQRVGDAWIERITSGLTQTFHHEWTQIDTNPIHGRSIFAPSALDAAARVKPNHIEPRRSRRGRAWRRAGTPHPAGIGRTARPHCRAAAHSLDRLGTVSPSTGSGPSVSNAWGWFVAVALRVICFSRSSGSPAEAAEGRR